MTRYLFNAKGLGLCGGLNDFNILKEPCMTGGGAPLPTHYKSTFTDTSCGTSTLTFRSGRKLRRFNNSNENRNGCRNKFK